MGSAYTLSGCEEYCVRPLTTGYNFGSVTEILTRVSGFSVIGLACDSPSYGGSPGATVCSSMGSAYTLSGCEEYCVRPSTTTGYNFGSVTETLTRVSGFGVSGLACESPSYGGSPGATVCGSMGSAYTLSGCEEHCLRPSSTTGYNFGSVTETLTRVSGFGVSGLACESPSY